MRSAFVRHAAGFAPRVGCLAALLLVGPSPWLAAGDARGDAIGTDTSVVQLVRSIRPAVVNIVTEQALPAPGIEETVPGSPLEEFFKRFSRPGQAVPDQLPEMDRGEMALASGFIIDADGYIVTNDHVVRDATAFLVRLDDGTELRAELVGRDALTELALLKVDAPAPLPTVSWGNSDAAEIGEPVVVLSSPFGLANTVTTGVLSARGREIGEPPIELLQTDASLNVGSSGGPMLNRHGEVIGVSVAILSPTGGNIGIGFAIPSSVAQPVIETIRREGEIRRGWLGVSIQEIDGAIARRLGLGEARGILITETFEGGPAQRAGLQIGDAILGFGGEAVGDASDLQLAVAGTEAGATATVEILRDGERQEIEVQVDDRAEALEARGESPAPAARPDAEPTDALGLTLAPITPELREMTGVEPDVSGALVTEVQPGGQAARRGLAPMDVITHVDGDAVASPEEVILTLNEAVERGEDGVLLRVRREGSNRFVALSVEER